MEWEAGGAGHLGASGWSKIFSIIINGALLLAVKKGEEEQSSHFYRWKKSLELFLLLPLPLALPLCSPHSDHKKRLLPNHLLPLSTSLSLIRFSEKGKTQVAKVEQSLCLNSGSFLLLLFYPGYLGFFFLATSHNLLPDFHVLLVWYWLPC